MGQTDEPPTTLTSPSFEDSLDRPALRALGARAGDDRCRVNFSFGQDARTVFREDDGRGDDRVGALLRSAGNGRSEERHFDYQADDCLSLNPLRQPGSTDRWPLGRAVDLNGTEHRMFRQHHPDQTYDLVVPRSLANRVPREGLIRVRTVVSIEALMFGIRPSAGLVNGVGG